ncbi:MAG: response regulator [Candidatus Viridilinea halotolerans]|uniref:Response regulator n=1 Tax=Candidatus Viridilinea halotolerans TaxID=2491704 RepID=A0A426TT20_9CHLR|nr:MAG: response regulator [Candidatus Viridilinea halotolerans]
MTKTVLIAEDDPSTRRLYRFLLSNSGYKVVEAEDGVSVLELLQTNPCQVLITDMNMPRMGGIDLVRHLRQQNSPIYVIMVTAFSTPDTEKQAFKVGINEYLTKPFEYEELERRVKNFFERVQTENA